jgi:Mg-chelatase subunit ChlD
MWGTTSGRRGRGTAGPCRRTRAAAVSAVAAAAALSSATLASADTMAASAGVPPSASPPTVAAVLGANRIPEAIVVLVDVSSSMSGRHGGLYPQVRKELPRFLAAFAKQEPKNEAAVITFGPRSETHITQQLSRPTSKIYLPPDATAEGTDIGYAFKLALQVLDPASSGFRVGGVLLLSDGRQRTRDSAYHTFQSPGWQDLHRRLSSLRPMQVAGYDLPLTINRVDRQDQAAALQAVFGSNWQPLSPNLADLGSELSLARTDILQQKVRTAAQLDSGRGVRVSWDGVPGAAGARPLDLTSGQAQAQVTLTATTRRIPLYVTGLTATVSGLPWHVTARLPAASGLIAPGRPVTLPVQLTWPKVPRPADDTHSPTWSGQITLSGQVRSTFSDALTNWYHDRSFSLGTLTGAAASSISETIPPPPDYLRLILFCLIALLVLVAVIGISSRLDGTLTLTTVDQVTRRLPLPRARPWLSASTEGLIGIPGKLTVLRLPFGRRMRVRLSLQRRLRAAGPLKAAGPLSEGGRTMLAGVDIVHDPSRAHVGSGYGVGRPDGP